MSGHGKAMEPRKVRRPFRCLPCLLEPIFFLGIEQDPLEQGSQVKKEEFSFLQAFCGFQGEGS